jgi:UDP-N-acetylglucosamine 2-epimerase (non-hydrolysing)
MIVAVVGARPNFIKMAPVIHEIRKRGIPLCFVHTGQHYDEQMSAVFVRELGLPEPDVNLEVGSAGHALQTATIMTRFDQVCAQISPRLVLVAGDVNSTLAAALTAVKRGIPVGHIESGLRSFDQTMPEEINRVLTDHVSSFLFTTEPSGRENLLREGIEPGKIHFVGNTMIDSLHKHLAKAVSSEPWRKYNRREGEYGLVTFHRPSNVDDSKKAHELARALSVIGEQIPLIFPAHPRTLAASNGLWTGIKGVNVVLPLGYDEFLGLMSKAKIVITDSGGVQEETTALQVPCVTVRPNTERPITLTEGTNCLVRPVAAQIIAAALTPRSGKSSIPELWDGGASPRILDIIEPWWRHEAAS